jgi:hypothetical protein
MIERRTESRLLCSDLVDVTWTGRDGRFRRAVANLEDISPSGVCLLLDIQLPLDTLVRIAYGAGELCGRVRYARYRDIGYFTGIRFDPGFKWSRRLFRPLHLLDPRALLRTGRPPRGSRPAAPEL